METITLTGRDSKLSRIQIELVKTQLERTFAGIHVLVKTTSSLGDRLQHIPLQTVEGTDFFTEEVFESLYTGEADIAVHSLKDMSAAHFFGGNVFAVTHRDEVRDVAVFNKNIMEKIALGDPVSIGTCSPRREVMATRFLKQALPQFDREIKIEVRAIRGNVDTRLRKLHDGEYDGTILAAAGLNRLLRHAEYGQSIKRLLESKRIMLLPIMECAPAPCQGAIVAEAIPQNHKAVNLLRKINHAAMFRQCVDEKRTALRYGAGCDQKFGVVSITYGNSNSIFAAGVNEDGNYFTDWYGLPGIETGGKRFWDGSTATSAVETTEKIGPMGEVVFVSNARAANSKVTEHLTNRKVWAAGTKTWFKLARKGIWVDGCADGLGLESLVKVWESPLFNIQKGDVVILTHEHAASGWKDKGWKAIGTYRSLNHPLSKEQEDLIQSADVLFWSSATQFHKLRSFARQTAIHACASGETYRQLKDSGFDPVVFPTTESFQQWKINNILSPTAG